MFSLLVTLLITHNITNIRTSFPIIKYCSENSKEKEISFNDTVSSDSRDAGDWELGIVKKVR